MTRSRKSSGKATAKQNQQSIAQMQGVINELVNAVTNDMGRLNGIMYALLKDLDKLKEDNCPHCGQVLFEPQLDLLPPSTHCPSCGEALNTDEQKTIDDFVNWDEGKSSEEE
ncbi:MAG: hypothetical protein GOVbin709_37 [Prokaryotic dsDNA virus sp.]|nr:MAG: hypothetical protein GOVbin709_37 [Prokaryotic dsDNA virus sp.]